MIRFFFKMKPWQLFTLTFGLPFFLQIVLMASMAVFRDFGYLMVMFFLIMIFYMGSLLGWMYSVSYKFNSLLPEGAKMKLGFFKFAIYYPIAYILFFMFIWSGMFYSLAEGIKPNADYYFMAIIPFHFFAMYCMFYILYFTSKTFRTAELQRKIGFSEYAGEFFMLWFYPIGLWVIQPRVNKLYEENFEKVEES